MNSTVNNGRPVARKGIKTRHLVAAAGLALAVSALVALGTISRDKSAPPSHEATALTGTAITSNRAPSVSYYVLDSQDEARRFESLVRQSEMAAFELTGESSPHVIRFLVVDSPEAQQHLNLMQAELWQVMSTTGTQSPVEIYDLRKPH